VGGWQDLRAMMPADGWAYRDAHYLSATLEVDRAAAQRWVPWPLRVPRQARATLFTAWFPWCCFGSVYHEAGLFLHAEVVGRPVLHCPWMIVDDDAALILGRELLGYPKKLGEIALDLEGDRALGVARRRGVELLRMEGSLGAVVIDPPPFLGRPHLNVRSSLGLAFPWLLAFTPRERAIEVRRARLEVEVARSERDPLHELGFGAVTSGYLHRVDLGGGRVPPLPLFPASPRFFLDRLPSRVR
jgi:acetoacetate decarboxylase